MFVYANRKFKAVVHFLLIHVSRVLGLQSAHDALICSSVVQPLWIQSGETTSFMVLKLTVFLSLNTVFNKFSAKHFSPFLFETVGLIKGPIPSELTKASLKFVISASSNFTKYFSLGFIRNPFTCFNIPEYYTEVKVYFNTLLFSCRFTTVEKQNK